jgi:putative membrane protein insertion efficiency factor
VPRHPERGVTHLHHALHRILKALESGLSWLLVFFIRAYQSVHVAFFRGSCRFHPTCSHYALEAIQTHGAGRGTLLAAWRILRCQPFCRGGFDPVPEAKTNQRNQKRPERDAVQVPAAHFPA